MSREKALFGVWGQLKSSEVNRILKPHGIRLVVKGSKEWGDKVTVTAQKIEAPVVAPAAPPAGPSTVDGGGAAGG